MGQLHSRLLDLAAQRDGAFGLRQPPPTQDVVAVLAQRGHPRLTVGSSGVGPIAVDPVIQPDFPRAQAVSTLYIGVGQPLPEHADQFVEPWLAQIRCSRGPYPLDVLIARRACGELSPVDRQHLAPVAVRVDLRHHADDQIGVFGREIDQRTIGFGQRSNRGHHEHHRGGGVGGAQFVGLDKGVFGQPLSQHVDKARGARQPRARDEHHIAALHTR